MPCDFQAHDVNPLNPTPTLRILYILELHLDFLHNIGVYPLSAFPAVSLCAPSILCALLILLDYHLNSFPFESQDIEERALLSIFGKCAISSNVYFHGIGVPTLPVFFG